MDGDHDTTDQTMIQRVHVRKTSNPMFTWHVHRWEPGKNVVWTALRVLGHTALNLLLKEHPGAGMQAVEMRRMHATGLAPQYEMEIWAEKSAQWEFCGVLVRVNISYPCPCHSFIMAPLLQTCELSRMIANREGKKKRPYFGRRIFVAPKYEQWILMVL